MSPSGNTPPNNTPTSGDPGIGKGAGPSDDGGRARGHDAIDVQIDQLEAQMADLQSRHPGSFGIAAAWADRHDAILAMTPADRLDEVRGRLRRIGIRWGVVSGPRVTQEIAALPPLHKRRPPKL